MPDVYPLRVRAPEWGSDVHGASLVGMLMIVVVLGGLAALAVVAVNNTSDDSDAIAVILPTSVPPDGSSATTTSPPNASPGRGVACMASADAARTATLGFYVSHVAYPTQWTDLTAPNPPSLVLPPGVTVNASNPNELDGYGWKLLMAGDGGTEPTLTCAARAT
jgi:hypothetical protein